MTRCIPQKQALKIHSAPNLASLHLCTCSHSVTQPLCLCPQSLDIHLFIWFQLHMWQPLSFPYYERRLGTCWHKAWARVYAQRADGENSVLIKEKRVYTDIFPLDGGSVGRDDQKWDFCSMRKVGINILSYFCKTKFQFTWMGRGKNIAMFSRNNPNALMLLRQEWAWKTKQEVNLLALGAPKGLGSSFPWWGLE